MCGLRFNEFFLVEWRKRERVKHLFFFTLFSRLMKISSAWNTRILRSPKALREFYRSAIKSCASSPFFFRFSPRKSAKLYTYTWSAKSAKWDSRNRTSAVNRNPRFHDRILRRSVTVSFSVYARTQDLSLWNFSFRRCCCRWWPFTA